MKKEMEMNGKPFALRRILQNAAGSFIVLMSFLLPVKFGSLAVMPEAAGFFPEDWFSWLIINWPANSFGIFAGVALLLALAAYGAPEIASCRGITGLLWCFALPLAAWVGCFNSPASFYAEGECCHLLGISAFCGAAWILLDKASDFWKKSIFCALAAGVFILSLSGLRQYFFGFAEMREYLASQQEKGIAISSVMMAKAADTRVYALMVSANILAGFLLLTLPLCTVVFAKIGKHFEPQNISVKLFTCAMLLPGTAVFLMTKTRAAFLCALLTLAILLFTLKFSKWLKAGLAAVILLTVIGGTCYIKFAGRGFGSLSERADYMRTAAIMLPEKPLAGHGWGGFFYRHMKEKTTSTDESAHDPHNIFASFILHAGFPAGLIASAALLFPLAVLIRRRKKLSLEEKMILWGSIAFTLHSCCDINMQVPACLAGAGLLFLAAMPGEKISGMKTFRAVPLLLFALLAGLGIFSIKLNRTVLAGDVAYTRFLDLLQTPPGNAPPSEQQIIQQFQEVEKLRPAHPFACNTLGDYYASKGDFHRAEQLYLESLKRDKLRPAVYMRLAMIALQRFEPEQAEELRKKAHALFPTHPKYKQLDKTP